MRWRWVFAAVAVALVGLAVFADVAAGVDGQGDATVGGLGGKPDGEARAPQRPAATQGERGWWGDSVALLSSMFRGTVHAVRDVLAPEFRPEHPNRQAADTDSLFPGETRADFDQRWRIRDRLVAVFDAAGAARAMEASPTATRYGVAVVLGGALFLFFLALQWLSGQAARWFMAAMFRWTGHPTWREPANAPQWNVIDLHNDRFKSE